MDPSEADTAARDSGLHPLPLQLNSLVMDLHRPKRSGSHGGWSLSRQSLGERQEVSLDRSGHTGETASQLKLVQRTQAYLLQRPPVSALSFDADSPSSTSLDSRSHLRRRKGPRLLGVTRSEETARTRGARRALVQAAVGFDLHRRQRSCAGGVQHMAGWRWRKKRRLVAHASQNRFPSDGAMLHLYGIHSLIRVRSVQRSAHEGADSQQEGEGEGGGGEFAALLSGKSL